MPTPSIQNSGGVWGESALSTYTGDDLVGLVVELSAAVATITRGDLVALSTSSGWCIRALVGTGAQRHIGVALATQATIGNPVPICVYGQVKGVAKDTASAVTAGDLVTRSGAVAASVLSLGTTTAITQLKDVGITIGIVQADATAGATTCDIFVCKV